MASVSYRKNRRARVLNMMSKMRAAKERKRIEACAGLAPRSSHALPDLVRRITLEDFVSGEKHVFDLHSCQRVDQYRIVVDGRPWRDAAGLSAALAGVRKSWGRYGRVRD